MSELHVKEESTLLRNSTLKERVEWALTKPDDVGKKSGITIKQQKENLKNSEKEWGNEMIGQRNNGQWTTLLGERLVRDILQLRGENPIKPERKSGFEPDWETDEYIYEVKTSNWWVDGTAGEKVYGTFIKYQNIPELYGKPLKIVCVANQEYELTHGKTKYFGPDITKKTQDVLDLASSWHIEYVKFSDLVSPVISQIFIEHQLSQSQFTEEVAANIELGELFDQGIIDDEQTESEDEEIPKRMFIEGRFGLYFEQMNDVIYLFKEENDYMPIGYLDKNKPLYFDRELVQQFERCLKNQTLESCQTVENCDWITNKQPYSDRCEFNGTDYKNISEYETYKMYNQLRKPK